MKKNFLKVASLLIAAMLLVVSCAQEVKAPESNLVEAKLGLAYGRDVSIAVDNVENQSVITYTYSLKPMWDKLTNGTEIFGEKTDADISGNFGVSATVENVNIGPVTPGLWEIHVKGKAGGKVVLEGKTAAYFVKGASTATVFVSPVNTDATETVKIELKMEDLGLDEKNVINYTITNLAKGTTSTTKGTLSKTRNSDASYTYKAKTGEAEGITVNAGYNTITFTTSESAGEGGITKTFLLIPGLPVKITGSVYPAAFVSGTASIKVLNMTGAKLGIKNGETTVNVDNTDKVFKLTNGASYSISVDDSTLNLNAVTSGLPAGTITGEPNYKWYVNGSEVKDGISADKKTLTFSRTVAGDYTVTCTIEYDYTYTNAKDNSKTTYTAIGDASLGNVRVMPAED